MGDLIKLYEIKPPLIEMLLKNDNEKTIKRLKDLAYEVCSNGNLDLMKDLLEEYGKRFDNSAVIVENGDILMIYNDIPYFICKA